MQHPAQLAGCHGDGDNWPKPKEKRGVRATGPGRGTQPLPRAMPRRCSGAGAHQHPARSRGSRQPGATGAARFPSRVPKQTPSLAATERRTSGKQITSGYGARGEGELEPRGGYGRGVAGEGVGAHPRLKDEGNVG